MINSKTDIFPKAFAVKHKDEEVREHSRSGGIFTALTDYILLQEGSVYGCVLDKNFLAKHIRVISKDERDLMRGSKYVQSDIGETYKQVKEDLKNKKIVLFSGTSCQISGLRSFLNGLDLGNLFCVDIICHGVPSRKVWTDYLLWQEKKVGERCLGVDFRNKRKFGWSSHVETLSFQSKDIDSTVFKKLFFQHSILRPSCFNCPYKDIIHPADINIGDYWGINKVFPDFNDDKGVSLVLINNDKGDDLFNNIIDSINYKKSKIEDCLQPTLVAPFNEPQNRKRFWKDYLRKDFSFIVKKYTQISILKKITRKVRKILK